ncbi:AAA family ATPase (plasmid) [Chromobacterium amazonense]|nr:division plane positioning ATPase MipZ [Chromobacterium amazonense]MDE1711800.1 AAA family ATPase [Chromobacterium amazonense]
MKSIATFSQKGGSGKSTLAVHLGVAAEEDATSVIIFDRDDAQASASCWAERRAADTPIVLKTPPSQLHAALKAGSAKGFGLAIIDGPPHSSPDAAAIARIADIILIPVRPTAFDLAAVGNAVKIVTAAGKQPLFVLSACPPRVPEVADARQALADFGEVAPVEIGERIAFSRAIATGQSVTEFDPLGKAAAEIRALWQWVEEKLQ